MSERERSLLDAAIGVVADGGLRALTHRAVDERAGVPIGSTSNRFRTREELLVGVLGRVLERESAVWAGASRRRPPDVDALARRLGRLVATLTTAERSVTLARHAVVTQAARDPGLGEAVRRDRRRLVAELRPVLEDLGSRRPDRDARHLLALLDGLLAARLVDPRRGDAPARPIAALLHGLLAPATPSPTTSGPGRRPRRRRPAPG